MDEKKTGARWHPFIGTMTVVLLVLAAASLFYAFQGAARTAAMEEQRNNFRLAVSDMATSALAAAGGQAAAFDVLGSSTDAAAKALRGRAEVLEDAARELFDERNPIGEIVRLGGWRMRVIGVLGRQGVRLGVDFDDMAVVPVATGMRMLNQPSMRSLSLRKKNASTGTRMM